MSQVWDMITSMMRPPPTRDQVLLISSRKLPWLLFYSLDVAQMLEQFHPLVDFSLLVAKVLMEMPY